MSEENESHQIEGGMEISETPAHWRVQVDSGKEPHDLEAVNEDIGEEDRELSEENEGTETSTKWRAAKSLLKLRDQVNAAFPNRNKASDGLIGDDAHCGSGSGKKSDHCPNIPDGDYGVVTALDITHDPSSGCDCESIVEAIRSSKDHRVKYIIWNRKICNHKSIGGHDPWVWRAYTGSNPHTKHAHFSVKADKPTFDSQATWSIGRGHEMEIVKLESITHTAEVELETVPESLETEGKSGSDSGDLSRAERLYLRFGKLDEDLSARAPASALESVIGRDDRVRITETQDSPWSMVCALEIHGPRGSGVGTGWLAGPKTVITAGHCVHHLRSLGGWATKITVTPGRDSNEKPFGSIVSRRFTSLNTWVNNQDPDFDIGCIHLDDPVGDRSGWFGFGAVTPEELQGHTVNISGYPADLGRGKLQYFHANSVLSVTPRRVFYDVDTFGGHSGSPVWIHRKAGAPPLVIGIHAYGIGGTPSHLGITANSAPRIIPEVYKKIKEWIADSNA